MPWHPGAGAGCSEQRPGGTVALGYIHTYILGGRYRDAVERRGGSNEKSLGMLLCAFKKGRRYRPLAI